MIPAAQSTVETPAKPGWRHYFNRQMLICVSLGFSSGLPLFILYNLLSAWLRSESVDLKSIGLFALVGFPYTWKFIWSPLMDRYQVPAQSPFCRPARISSSTLTGANC